MADFNVSKLGREALLSSGKAANVAGVLYHESVEYLVKDKPRFTVSGLTREAITSSAKALEPKVLYNLNREILYLDNPQFRVSMLNREVITGTPKAAEFKLLYSVTREILYRPAAISLTSVQREILLTYTKLPTILAQAKQFYAHAVQKTDVKPLDQIISMEQAKQFWQMTVQQSNVPEFPWSYTQTREFVQTVIQASPITTISFDSTKQFISLAASAAVGEFARPEDVWSKESTGQIVMLVCQSLDIPYIPPSGVFTRQYWMLTVQASALPMWKSPASVGEQVLNVVQRLPIRGLPRSMDTVPQVFNLSVQKRDPDGIPRSPIDMPQVFNLAVVKTDMPEHFSSDLAAQLYQLTAQQTVMPEPYGSVRVAEELVQVVTANTVEMPLSKTSLPQYRANVVQCSDFPLPVDMLMKGLVRQNLLLVAGKTDYPPAGRTSPASVGSAWIMYNQGFPLPSPEDVYNASKYRFVGQFYELVAQSLPGGLPISRTRVLQFYEKVVQSLPMPSPGEIAQSGAFARQIAQQVMTVAEYPDTGQVSTLSTTQVMQHIALTDEFPAPGDMHQPVDAIQVIEHVASTDEFPDPNSLHMPLNVHQVMQHLSFTAEYPDAGTLHAPVVAFAMLQQVAFHATYPDKDVPQSDLWVRQLAQQVATVVTYPDKNKPQSTVRATQIRANVMTRDVSMYELPKPPRRHRVKIVCRFVY